MDYEDANKLKELYSKLINVVSDGKLNNKQYDLYCDINQILYDCIQFSPYTHFYNQLLVDTMIKTYNMDFIRSDLIVKSSIRLDFDEEFNKKEYQIYQLLLDKDEDKMNTTLMISECFQKINGIAEKRNKKFLDFFNSVKDSLVSDFMKKKNDFKSRIIIIGDYSNNKIIRELTPEQRIYLYESKGVFDLHYLNISSTNTIFLDTTFKVKYIANNELKREDKELDIIELAEKIKENNIEVQEVYELDNTEEQIRFELFKVIENNFIIKQCANCQNLFIPEKSDKQYCDRLYKDTGKTCKEIGAINKHKEKIANSKIYQEYNREYKRMHGLHYNHLKEFKEKQFKEWSKKAIELRNTYTDDRLEEFKIELKKLSEIYWKNNKN